MKYFNPKLMFEWCRAHIPAISAETFAWLAIVLMHSATVPSLVSTLVGLSDRMPTLDLVLLTWSGLVAMFIQAVIQRNMIQLVTISVGFMMQSLLLALIFFK